MRALPFLAVGVVVAVSCAQPTVLEDDAGDDAGPRPDGAAGCPIVSQKKCGTTCTDVTKDLANCGACGVKCTAG